ncbi:PREDICTED: uncharacterized protein LOC104789808 [Camelina sativa]|uniref:Uncharacterized protein LOC104789808 n=1 Tax=Camelina sativa TaxID=90675 RepID=A0ABM0ZCD6_CAMSA|nr:PREDICTED: uncharacterized protein LOC104789808 [Camelina sativa]
MWQALTGCISVTANLKRRGVACDIGCSRCGAEEETVNHVLFRCPPARQAWALAHVPVGLQNFPTESVYANVDHFLGRNNPGNRVDFFPWLMWYIWKARNAKVFENRDEHPDEVVRLAEGEASSWLQAQMDDGDLEGPPAGSPLSRTPRGNTVLLSSVYLGYRCFVDGSWKESDVFSGAGWCCTSVQRESPLLGATNYRRSLSPLHAEVEAFMWAMRCMIGHDIREVTFLTDCSDLVKMVSSPHEWPAFAPYLDDIKMDREEFSSFSLIYVSRNANVRADSLARKARASSHHILFVNDFPPN